MTLRAGIDQPVGNRHTRALTSLARPFVLSPPGQLPAHEASAREAKENQVFKQNEFEAFRLQLKAENDTLTPAEQTTLEARHAQRNDFWAQRLGSGVPAGHNFAHVSVQSPSIGIHIQLKNQILSNTYERSESPVTTIKKFVAQQTGQTETAVRASMKKGLAKQTGSVGDYLGELDSAEADYRPIMTKAYIDDPTGSAARTDLITAIGKLGYLEDLLRRGGISQDYDGGHLLALEFFNGWNDVNSARNVAPQERNENEGHQKKAWRAVERFEKRKYKNKSQKSLVVTSYVNYPTDQYTVSLRTIADTLLDGPVKTAVNQLWLSSLRRVTIDTRLPSQFVTEHTPSPYPLLPGEPEDFVEGKEAGGLPTASIATRVPRTFLAPVEDYLLRALASGSRGSNTRWGGAYVQSNQSIYGASLLRGIAEDIAQMAVYYFMIVHGYTAAAAVLATLSYFGSSTGEGILQRIAANVSGQAEMPSFAFGTSLVNSLLRYSGGDRLFSLGASLLNGILRSLLSPTSVPATLAGMLPR